VSDPLAQVAALPEVMDAVTDARRAVDRLLGHRILRRRSAEVTAESALRGARASAALEGAALTLEELRDAVAVPEDESPEGPIGAPNGAAAGHERGLSDPVVQGSLRISAEIGVLTETWRQAPRQALARLHVLAAAGAVPPDRLGRPRATGEEVGDPLELGPPPTAAEVAARLDVLSGLLTTPTEAPALVVGAIAQGELLVLRPFGWGDGMVARAAQRLTLVERGLDPKSLTAPEVGHAELAGEYAEALRAYAEGTPEGVAWWVRHCADAVSLAARDSLAICEAFLRG
jgi:Fic family protein